MKHLLATTALVAAFALSTAQAQTTSATIMPPEGYIESNAVLTSNTLEGTPVYNANNDEIGTIHGLVFANGTASTGGATEAPAAFGATGSQTEAVGSRDVMKSDNRDAGAAADAKADGAVPSGQDIDSNEAAPAAPTTGNAADSAESDGVTPTAGVDATGSANAETDATAGAATDVADTGSNASDDTTPADATGSTNADAGTLQGDAERVEPATPDMSSRAGDNAVTDGATQSDAGQTSTGTTMDMSNASITHAIIDVGGFLGIGVHRVAVPIEDLVIYTGADSDDIRIYLPWTEDQLKEMPEFDEEHPDTPAL